MSLKEYESILDKLPNLTEKKEEKEEPTILDELEYVKKELQKYNAEHDESLEPSDFENTPDDENVEGWEPKIRKRQ